MKTATIVGAGLVGSLWSVYLSKAGYKVTIFERRSDIRKAEITAGKSINLSLSDRGWKALKNVNLEKEIDFSSGLKLNGALSIATTEGRWQELKRQATTAQLNDDHVEIIDKEQIKKNYPIINLSLIHI